MAKSKTMKNGPEMGVWAGMPVIKGKRKGSNNCIGYGYVSKRRKIGDKRRTRRAGREIRKYGFDLSEVWSLDCTIMDWMADEFGGYFAYVGNNDDWDTYDFDGTDLYDKYIAEKDIDPDAAHAQWIDRLEKIVNPRYDDFKQHLSDFLKNADGETYNKFASFCSPRLRALAKIVHGWPGKEWGIETPEDWRKMLLKMADDFESHEYSQDFADYFFHLWD